MTAAELQVFFNIAITLILPRWTNDVKGVWLAPALRREQVAERVKGAE